jgi:hypothetical protein
MYEKRRLIAEGEKIKDRIQTRITKLIAEKEKISRRGTAESPI